MSFLNNYYAVWDGEAYFNTAFNARSRFEVKEAILSLIQPETDEEDFQKYLSMDIREICNIKGWTLETSNTPFKESYRSAFEFPSDKYRVRAKVTTYCYIDVVADNATEAKEIAKTKHREDFYTIDDEESGDSFDIVDAEIIS